MTTPFIWHNGSIKPWAEATVHVSAHALHYGSSVFEGERVYATHRGPAYFRLAEHTQRLFESARMYEIDIVMTSKRDQTSINAGACLELIRAQCPPIARRVMPSAVPRGRAFHAAGAAPAYFRLAELAG
ncbi:MAG: hypothetical protein WDW36_001888 [Sanguina aurantia]